MACNTCNKISSKCSCPNNSLTTPCSYTDCSTGSERCSEVTCTECVSYCGTTFEIGSTGQVIRVETGERLDAIIQKLALMVSQGVGACTANDIHHAPYNVYVENITSTTANIVWGGTSSLTDHFDVYLSAVTPVSWVQQNTADIPSTTLTFGVTGLAAATSYRLKVTSTDTGAATCDSVEVIITTAAA